LVGGDGGGGGDLDGVSAFCRVEWGVVWVGWAEEPFGAAGEAVGAVGGLFGHVANSCLSVWSSIAIH
jgi:hypothetical protein